jgi:glutamate N-acetyltransferase/amino-acid N-acetyltransferase
VRLLGIAKGAGMIQPRLATMLVFLFTDARSTPRRLQVLLRAACRVSFERISVDGDTSTNDTVILQASGASGVVLEGRATHLFQAALTRVCQELARKIVQDGEGACKFVTLRVEGAPSTAAAERVARQVANSPLVKTALAGADPNWGRVLAAVGASGVAIEANRVDIWLGRQAVCRRGKAYVFDEAKARRYLRGREVEMRIRLGHGSGFSTFWTCDLTADYIRINADYRS